MSYPVRPARASGVIPAQPWEVLAFVADTRNDPKWCVNVETVEMLTPEPLAVGSRFRYHQYLERRDGSRVQFDGDVGLLALTDTSVTWEVEDRFQRRIITIEIEAAAGGTRATQVTEAEFKRPPGLGRWVYPAIARRTMRKQFAALADHFAGEK